MMVAVVVASLAALAALGVRYRRHVIMARWYVLLHGVVLVLLALARQRGIGSELLVGASVSASRWGATTAMALATVYLLWSCVSERLLTLSQTCGAILAATAFGVTWISLLPAAGVQLAGMSATRAVAWLLPILLPLTASVLAPWSLSRVRHL
jgi:hypothetical protein